jgi:hypothetical protein
VAYLPAEETSEIAARLPSSAKLAMVNVSLRSDLLHPVVAASGREAPDVKREDAQNFFDIGSYACSNSG